MFFDAVLAFSSRLLFVYNLSRFVSHWQQTKWKLHWSWTENYLEANRKSGDEMSDGVWQNESQSRWRQFHNLFHKAADKSEKRFN